MLVEHGGTTVALRRGTVVIANMDYPADWDNLDAIRSAAAVVGLPVEDLDPCQAPGLRPASRHAPVAALLCAQEGWVDSRALLSALDTATRAHPGVERERARAIRVLAAGGRAVGAELADGTRLAAGAVVLAAGVGTDALLVPLCAHTGPLPRVLAAKGASLVLDVAEAVQPPMVLRTRIGTSPAGCTSGRGPAASMWAPPTGSPTQRPCRPVSRRASSTTCGTRCCTSSAPTCAPRRSAPPAGATAPPVPQASTQKRHSCKIT